MSLTLQSIWRCNSNTCLIEKCCHKQQKYLSFWFFCIVTLTVCLSSFMMEKVNLKSYHFNIFGSCVKRGTTKFFTVIVFWQQYGQYWSLGRPIDWKSRCTLYMACDNFLRRVSVLWCQPIDWKSQSILQY